MSFLAALFAIIFNQESRPDKKEVTSSGIAIACAAQSEINPGLHSTRLNDPDKGVPQQIFSPTSPEVLVFPVWISL